MSSSHTNTMQYGCPCGKAFSGEPNKINMLLRLHYKKCKFEQVKEVNYVVVNSSSSNPRSSQKIVQGLVEEGNQTKLINSILKTA